jgi:glyoxylase-like metal-dependent hydrolase (beta-lactamase superfamily II)
MIVKSFTFNPFQTNCFVCSVGRSAVVIDPSSAEEAEHREVMDYIVAEDLDVERILLTHAHLDHIFGLAHLCDALNVPFWMHRSDLPLLEHAAEQALLFRAELDEPPAPGGFLEDHGTVNVGANSWTVLHTPGHSPGSISFHDRSEDLVFGGDVLFAGSIGRTDLWQGSLPTLMHSIFQKLVPLGHETRVYAGHGPDTTIGREIAQNPFLAVREEFDQR